MVRNAFIGILILLLTNLFAVDEEFELAKVNRSSIDLYEAPKINSPKIKNKYLYNDIVKVYNCNRENWCKVDGGYVKQYLLKFETLKEVLKQNGVISVLHPSKKLKTKWNNNKMFFRISVNESVVDILTAIARQNNSQILFEKGIEGTETLSIEDMPLEGAFELLLQRNNLEYKWQKNTIIVNSIKNTKIKKEFIILKNISIDKLIILLKRYNIYTKIKNKVIFDKEMNAVYIEAEESVISELQKILMRFETAEKLLRETRIKRTQEDIAFKRLERINHKQIALINKKKKYGFKAYDDWQMSLEIIPLKYINVTAKEMEFQGEKIKVPSLEDTLKGLLGTGYAPIDFDSSSADKNSTVRMKYTKSAEKSYLKIDARTNSVIIKDYPDRIEEIKQIILKLDIPSKLVEIEVTIATGTTGFTNRLGVSLGGSTNSANTIYGAGTNEGAANTINSVEKGKAVSLLQPASALGLSASMLFSGSKNIISAQLNLMEEEGSGKVLSNPKIVTLNNREATIISGNSINIPVATNDKIGVEKVQTGISIKATPHIIEKGENVKEDIMLDITIESSSLGDSIGGNINTNTNKINTNVIMVNGQTLILGGLFQYTQTNTDGGIPLLKDIPMLGFLFSTTSKLLNKNELVFFITPRIITSDMVTNMQSSKQMHYQDTLQEGKKEYLNQVAPKKDDKLKNSQSVEKRTTQEISHKQYVNNIFGIN